VGNEHHLPRASFCYFRYFSGLLNQQHPLWRSSSPAASADAAAAAAARSWQAVGFDMDYTLAQYKPETFEALAHEQTVRKLVEVFGYPPVLYEQPFDWTYMMRGLVIDKVRPPRAPPLVLLPSCRHPAQQPPRTPLCPRSSVSSITPHWRSPAPLLTSRPPCRAPRSPC
jgi:hypothetical protein